MSVIDLTLQPPPVAPVRLHDGREPVTAIAVFALFRNNAPYLQYLFRLFAAWEQAHTGTRFYYYFLENNSNDGTTELLREFFKTHRGQLLTGALEKDYVNRGENYDRTMTLAQLRNTLVDGVIGRIPEAVTWSLFLDSHIYMQTDTILRLFQHRPASANIGVLSTYTGQIYTVAQIRSWNLPIEVKGATVDPATLIDLRHYFDTFAFVDNGSHNHWPYCAFARCLFCPSMRPKPYAWGDLIPESQTLVDVKSAFGGCALIDMDVLRHPRCRWDTRTQEYSGEKTLAEHVLFCDRVTAATGKRIVVAQDVQAFRAH